MSEDEAKQWVLDRYGEPGMLVMATLAELIMSEQEHQNLVSQSTLPLLWSRHIVDSAQLIDLAEGVEGAWLDIGTGAGFPGLVVAALSGRRVILSEPRKRRAEFLVAASRALGVEQSVEVAPAKVQAVKASASVISARAVATLSDLLGSAIQCSTPDTLWIMPKGRGAREEVAYTQQTWHGVFHVERSITDPESLIVLAEGVLRR